MNIVTVRWVGGKCRGAWKYGPEYISALRNQLARFGHSLTVLSNDEGDRPLLYPEILRSFWAKCEIFAPENRDLLPALVVDLDTFFVGDPAPILKLDGTRLWLIHEFMTERRRGETGLFIAPKAEISERIWERVLKDDRLRTDGELIRRFPHDYIDDAVSGIVSYKVHCLKKLPDDARVVCFHGIPKPKESTGWAREFFERSIEAL